METKELKPGDKVKVIATNEKLASFGMNDAKINRNLRKYESTISEIIVKGGFPEEKNGVTTIHKAVVLDSTFTMPAHWLRLASEADEEVIEKADKKIKDEVKETEEVEEEEDANEDQNND